MNVELSDRLFLYKLSFEDKIEQDHLEALESFIRKYK